MGRAAATWNLVRPHNALIAAAGVLVGGVGTFGLEVHWTSLALTAVAAALGVAGGNALNDARDVEVDRRAHPERPLPRGLLTVGRARSVAAACLTLAVAVAAGTNLLVFLLALQLLLILLAYELDLKRRGLLGHFFVSYNVGALFLLGALAAGLAPLTYDAATLTNVITDARLLLALTMGLLALALNGAREIYKAAEDAGADAAERHTYAVVRGPRRAQRLAALLLLLVVPLSLAPYAFGIFDVAYVALLTPLLLLLVYVPFVADPGRAQRLIKMGMLAGFAPLLAVGLL